LLAPRSQHNRAVSLPVFAQQVNGVFQEQNGQNGNSNGERRGHHYQSSFSGMSNGNGNAAYINGNGNAFGNGYGLAIQDGGINMNGLNGWAEEEVVGN